jgi:uncharacterized spore protein YtfJ
MSVPVFAQEGIQESAKFMEALVTQIKTLLNADGVLGTPLDFDGTKIIPVVGYGFGFGAGSGTGGDTEGEGSGAAGGAGGGMMPTSILVITKDGEVKVLPAKKGIMSEVVSALTPIMLEAIKTKHMKSPEEVSANPPAEEKKTE